MIKKNRSQLFRTFEEGGVFVGLWMEAFGRTCRMADGGCQATWGEENKEKVGVEEGD